MVNEQDIAYKISEALVLIVFGLFVWVFLLGFVMPKFEVNASHLIAAAKVGCVWGMLFGGAESVFWRNCIRVILCLFVLLILWTQSLVALAFGGLSLCGAIFGLYLRGRVKKGCLALTQCLRGGEIGQSSGQRGFLWRKITRSSNLPRK